MLEKLNEEKVIAIKRMLEDEISFVDIASEFKVSEKTIRNIKNNKTWTHVDINKKYKKCYIKGGEEVAVEDKKYLLLYRL